MNFSSLEDREINIYYCKTNLSTGGLEICIEDLFSLLPEKPALVSIKGKHVLNWDGRGLSDDQAQSIVAALKLISNKGLPTGPNRLDGSAHELRLNISGKTVDYQWWGELPKAWSGLALLISELEKLVISKK